MSGSAVGSLVVKIGADTAGIRRGGDQSADIMDKLAGKAKALGPLLASIGAAAAAAGAALAGKLTKDGLTAVDNQAKLARRLGATIDGLRGLQLAASDAGIDTAAMTTSLTKLDAKIGEAMRGMGTAAQSFKRLGLNARELAEMDVDQRVATIADRMQDMGLSTQQVADELRQMGVRSAEVITLMQAGGDAIRAGKDEIRAFGLALSDVDAAKVEAANDAMGRIGLSVEAVSQRLAVQLAPTLQYVAEWFAEIAKENSSLVGVVDFAVDTAIKGYGMVADTLVGVQATFAKFSVVAAEADHAVAKFAYSAARSISELVDKHITVKINAAIRAFNRIPGFDIPELSLTRTVDESLGQLVISTRKSVDEAQADLMRLALTELPSEALARKLAEIKERVESAVRESAPMLPSVAPDFTEPPKGKKDQQSEVEKYREALAQKIAVLHEHVASEEEIELARHNQRLASLQAALDQELVTEGEAQRLREQLTQKHADRITEIRKKGMSDIQKFQSLSFQKQAQQVVGALTQITATAASENKKMFRAHKAFAIVQALINTSLGVTQALAAFPPPVSFVMAAAQLAAGLSSVASIKSQNFTGGGGGGSAPAAPPSAPAAAAAAGGGGGGGGGGNSPGQLAQINLIGDFFTRSQVESLIDGINDATADGKRLVIR